jgi:hypothetical protein
MHELMILRVVDVLQAVVQLTTKLNYLERPTPSQHWECVAKPFHQGHMVNPVFLNCRANSSALKRLAIQQCVEWRCDLGEGQDELSVVIAQP